MDLLEFAKKHTVGIRLFLLAFLTLYLELALIRYTAAEVLYLGYFSNFVLISVFLGIGVGFLMGGKKVELFRYLPQTILFLLAYVLVTRIDATALRHNIGQLFFGHNASEMQIPLELSLTLIFILMAFAFACIAQATARCFKHYKPLVAYSLDIGGSLAGIAVFTLHSCLGGTPLQWFAVAWVLIAVLSLRRSLFNAVLMGVGVALLVFAGRPDAPFSEWSPYQRIDVSPIRNGYHLLANGIGHQTMVPVGMKEAVYDYAYTELVKRRGGRKYENALVIGAGSGTDVAYALHYGVQHVDAVEIDPQILRAGRALHPARPYADERVQTHVTDGRAFMERTENRYDLIIFALPDSLASFSNLSNIRLESFLFTVESFGQARELLNDDGVLVLYNYYRKRWLVEKLAEMLAAVFGHDPVIRTYNDERGGMLSALAIGRQLAGEERDGPSMELATDDWPFLYMRESHLPPMYLAIMLLFIGCAVVGVVATGNAGFQNVRENGPFFLMGAAFLLLETKSIIQFSLLFGATWLVNSLVFFAILCSVLIANLIVAKLDFKSPFWPFALLLVSLVMTVVLPLQTLLGIESFPLRYTIASLVLFSPIFCANLVFGYLFKDTPKSDTAFGWNLIGTMIGGAIEYTSLSIGYHMLAIVVAVLYVLTAVWAIRMKKSI